MKDSLAQQFEATGGMPEIGTRISILVVALFILGILSMLVYFRMKEQDEGLRKDQ